MNAKEIAEQKAFFDAYVNDEKRVACDKNWGIRGTPYYEMNKLTIKDVLIVSWFLVRFLWQIITRQRK